MPFYIFDNTFYIFDYAFYIFDYDFLYIHLVNKFIITRDILELSLETILETINQKVLLNP
jgi:hypothetical protein